jgi:hypothetical protein
VGFVETKNIWRCDYCGKEGMWSTGWQHKTIMHKTWDETLVACSDSRAAAIDKTRNNDGNKRHEPQRGESRA